MAFDGDLFPSEWSLALQGELQAYTDAAADAVQRAALRALQAIAQEGKDRLRGQVVAAGLGKAGAGEGKGSGRSLASAIRFEVYPNKGDARGPAALLYIQPSAVKIYEAFEEGARITAGAGKFLTIPIPGSPADRRNFGDKPRGTTVLAALKAKGIETAYIPPRNGRAGMIVAKSVRLREDKRGRLRAGAAKLSKSGALASGSASVPLFWLVPSADIPKKLSLRAEFRRIATRFYERFVAAFAEEMNKIEAAAREAA